MIDSFIFTKYMVILQFLPLQKIHLSNIGECHFVLQGKHFGKQCDYLKKIKESDFIELSYVDIFAL